MPYKELSARLNRQQRRRLEAAVRKQPRTETPLASPRGALTACENCGRPGAGSGVPGAEAMWYTNSDDKTRVCKPCWCRWQIARKPGGRPLDFTDRHYALARDFYEAPSVPSVPSVPSALDPLLL